MRNVFDGSLCSKANVSSGMKRDLFCSERICPLEFVCQKFDCKFIFALILVIAKVDDIWRMHDDFFDAVIFHILPSFFDFHQGQIFSDSILRCTGINHHGICPIRCRFFCGSKKHLFSAHFDMRSKFHYLTAFHVKKIQEDFFLDSF